jgi:hypothetical protein
MKEKVLLFNVKFLLVCENSDYEGVVELLEYTLVGDFILLLSELIGFVLLLLYVFNLDEVLLLE